VPADAFNGLKRYPCFDPLKASHMTHPYRVGEREDSWAFGNVVTESFVASTGLKNRL